MLDFVFILAIILEIILTVFIVVKINEFEKKINLINEKLILTHGLILEALKSIRSLISKVNKVTRIFKNKRFITISQILKVAVNIIQIYLFVRSISKSKNFINNLKNIKKINFKLVKKILYANIIYKLINQVLVLFARFA